MNKKLLLLALSFTLIFGILGCKNKTTEANNYQTVATNTQASGASHNNSVISSDNNLVVDGNTNYKILIKANERQNYSEALSELVYFFKESTSAKLDIVEENSSLDYTFNYISLGNTELFKNSGIDVDYSVIGDQGYRIVTKNQNIFINGKSLGVLYGVYDFLNKIVDFETYSNKVTYYEKKENIKLPLFDVTEAPDILYRVPVTGAQLSDRTLSHRMRLQKNDEIIIDKGSAHNMLRFIVPFEKNYEEHPSWFSGDFTQLCYTARGNKEEYEAMVNEAVENIKVILDETPDRNVLSLTQMDVQTWCECTTCQSLKEKYGSNSASQIFFINDVTSRVKDWLDNERNGREVQFMFFAYHKSEAAPVTQNQDGSFSAIDGIKVNDNVSVWIAPIYADYTISINDPMSVNIRTMFNSWHSVANSYFVWAYNVYFDNYLIPYDSYGAIKEFISFLVSHNVKFLWPQGNWDTFNNTGYDDLKGYLFSKLMWNCNLDINELIHDYFTKVYREAGEIMESTFYTFRAFSETQRSMGRSGNIYSSPVEQKYWPKRYLTNQLDRMEEAKELVKKYENTDPEIYQAITDSIICETISLRFLLIKLYSNTYNRADFAKLKSDFKYDVNRLGFTMISEGGPIDGFLE